MADSILQKHKWAILYLIAVFTAAAFVLHQSYFNKVENPPLLEVINFSGKAEVRRSGDYHWQEIQRGEVVGQLDVLRTSAESDVDLRFKDHAFLRLKENSQLAGKTSNWLDWERSPDRYLELEKGSLLGYFTQASENDFPISAPLLQILPSPESLFYLKTEPANPKQENLITVLSGQVHAKVKTMMRKHEITIQAMEKAEMDRGKAVSTVEPITRQDWSRVKEGYDLIDRASTGSPDLLMLRQREGGFFEEVSDTGAFYTPRTSYAFYEFFNDKDPGKSALAVTYDVFLNGSYAGIFFKVKGLDSVKYQGLEFETKKAILSGAPDLVKIEVKSSEGVLKIYSVSDFQDAWSKVVLPFDFPPGKPISEITFVFLHDKAGGCKIGKILFKNFRLIPRT